MSAISEIDSSERKSMGGKKPNKELEKDKYGKKLKKELEKKINMKIDRVRFYLIIITFTKYKKGSTGDS